MRYRVMALACGLVGCGNAETGYEPACFVAGTQVQTDRGARSIEKLVPGDRVLSVDPATRRQRLAPVTALHQSVAPVHQVRVGEAVIRGVSREHPFWCDTERRWRTVAELQVGHALLVRDPAGSLRPETLIEVGPPGPPAPVTTLSVGGPWPTFVAEGVVVHNKQPPCCTGDSPWPPGGGLRRMTVGARLGWDGGGAVGVDDPVAANGPPLPVLQLRFGPEGWDGGVLDPARGCTIDLPLDGWTHDPSTVRPLGVDLVGSMDPAAAVSTCEPEDWRGTFLEGEDAVGFLAGLRWSLHHGGPVDPEVAELHTALLDEGYPSEELWGAELRSNLFLDEVHEGIGYAWQLDAQGQVVLDAQSQPARHTLSGWTASGTPAPAVVHQMLPWVFDLP